MMDYNKTRSEAEARKKALMDRLKEIPKEIKKLAEESDQHKRELIGIDQILDGLSFMDSSVPPDFEPAGFTDKIRKILSETEMHLSPTQIRDALEAKGVEGSTSKNLLINVHKVIERIEDELDKKTTREGKTAYKRKVRWIEAPNSFYTLANLSGNLDNAAPGHVYGFHLPDSLETKDEPENILKTAVGRPQKRNKALYGE